jgi:hypothetical protein
MKERGGKVKAMVVNRSWGLCISLVSIFGIFGLGLFINFML